jgi:D-arginine dehydrogenase
MQAADFIVIGAGMAGVSIAAELAKEARVVLIERESQPGYHATGRSAALFAESYGGPEIRALTRASRGFLENPGLAFTEAPLLSKRGCLFIAREDQREALARLADELAGQPYQSMSKSEIKALISLIKSEVIVEGLFDHRAMDIEVNALLHGFLRQFRSCNGVAIFDQEVPRARRTGGRWKVEGAWGAVTAPTLINACGAWADDFAASCTVRKLGLSPLRRTAVLIDPPAGVDIHGWPCTIDVDEEFYFKPDAGKLLLSPADETLSPPTDAQPDELDIAIAVDRVQGALDVEVRRVNHSWAGLRTFAPDRVPVVGFDPTMTGFFWFAGQGGYGIQTAPAMARLGAALANGLSMPADLRDEGLDLTRIVPSRFDRAVAAVQLAHK